MASGIIESQRSSQAAHNQLLSQLVDHLAASPKPQNSTHRERLRHAHEASYLMNRIADSAAELAYSYDNTDRQAEIELLGGGGAGSGSGESSGDVAEFYNRLGNVKDFHRRNPNAEPPVPAHESFVELYGPELEGEGDFLDRLFTGEEALGRYFDLNPLHAQYNNLPQVQRLSYLQFLDSFEQFDNSSKLSKQKKLSGEKYKAYLENLLAYLKDFSERAFPLEDPEEVEEQAFENFEQAWRAKQVAHWQANGAGEGKNGEEPDGEGIWCAACKFSSMMRSVIIMKLAHLKRWRLSTGQKMYSKETVYKAHLTSKKHIKAAATLESRNGAAEAPQANGSAHDASGSTSKDRDAERSHYLARLEAIITALMQTSWLAPIRADTKSNVERKAALTDKERMQELQDMEAREAEEVAKARAEGSKPAKDAEEMEVEDEKIYNPLKLPIGWDGKPIPFVSGSSLARW